MKILLGDLVKRLNGRIIGDSRIEITDIKSLENAGEGDITFFSNPRYQAEVKASHAAAILVAEPIPNIAIPQIVVSNPYACAAELLRIFHPEPIPELGIHPKAFLDAEVSVGRNCSIGPFVAVGFGCVIGDGVIIKSGAVLERGNVIGSGSIIHSNVVVRYDCRIGQNVIIHAGTVIGSDGFGYTVIDSKYKKIPQVGIVVIEDNVEIGAGVTIDRATMGETRICRGTKIDNQVHIAHNVTIGQDSVLVAQVGIAGSTQLGARVVVGGQAGFAGHIKIADDVTIGARTGVTSSIRNKGIYSGFPAQAHKKWLKIMAYIARLPKMNLKIKELERVVKNNLSKTLPESKSQNGGLDGDT